MLVPWPACCCAGHAAALRERLPGLRRGARAAAGSQGSSDSLSPAGTTSFRTPPPTLQTSQETQVIGGSSIQVQQQSCEPVPSAHRNQSRQRLIAPSLICTTRTFSHMHECRRTNQAVLTRPGTSSSWCAGSGSRSSCKLMRLR